MQEIGSSPFGAVAIAAVSKPLTEQAGTSWHDWLPLVVLPVAVTLLTTGRTPRWIVMWMLAFAIYAGCKWVTWRHAGTTNAPVWRHAAYLFAWPGLDAAAFLNDTGLAASRSEWIRASGNLAIGLTLIFRIARLALPQSAYLAGWIAMTGMVLTLHFGIFALLSCAWRRVGVQARPVMNAPLRSKNLTDFWSRRWNTAFRDLTHRNLFRPLTERFGPVIGLSVGFVFSGLVHDAVISWPACGGWGGPTSFFAIQAASMLLERSRFGRDAGLRNGRTGRLFAAAVVVLPAPLLFHRPFIITTVIPFLHAMGAA